MSAGQPSVAPVGAEPEGGGSPDEVSPDEGSPEADLVVGLGCRPGASVDAVRAVVADVLGRHGLSPGAVRAFATVAARADEPALREIAGAALLSYPAEVLDRVRVPHPSARVAAAVGTASVAEAAAVHAATMLAGPDGTATLIAGKLSGSTATAAVARIVGRA